MDESKSSIEITTVSKCVIDCDLCPQKIFQENYHGCRTLSLENFKTALLTIPKNIAIHFSGFAEPFLNPECMNMIEHAHLMGHKIVLYSTLVGLDAKDIDRLKRCNPYLILHLPDNLGNAKIPITEEYKNTLPEVLKQMHVAEFSVMNKSFASNGRAGQCKNSVKIHRHGWFWCDKLHNPNFVMLPNCDVVLCCMDFGLKHKLGNLLDQSYLEITNSPYFEKIRDNRFHWNSNFLCRECMFGSIRWNILYKISKRYETLKDKYNAKT